jgi:uncharacterized protein YbjT (DUF2867 family)
MSSKPILAVFGATGAQGGGVVRAALADPKSPFSIRAITRNVESDKARALAAQGIEVVAGNIDDEASLVTALAGAQGAFCVTNFWEHFSAERETTQGKNLARAAKQAGVKHAIWSTFEDVRQYVPLNDLRMPTLHEKYKVPHFDAKADANATFTELGVPTTFLLTSFYWENMIFFGSGPQRGPDGVLGLTFPLGDKPMPSIAAGDIGGVAYGVFLRPELIGTSVGAAGGHLTGAQMAAGLSKAIGQEVRYNDVPADVYRSFGFPGADDLGNMFQFKRDFNDVYCGHRSLAKARELFPAIQTYESWLAGNAAKIPIP